MSDVTAKVLLIAAVPFLAASANASDPLLYTTLDDTASVSTPVFGTGVGATIETTPADDFVAGAIGDGIRCDSIGERVLFQQTDGVTQNVELDRGTLELWYRPDYDHDDDLKYTIWGTGQWMTPGSLHLGKHNVSNENALFLIFFDISGKLIQNNVAVDDYAWTAGEWILFRVTWDFTIAPGVQNIHVYMNEFETPLSETPNGPVTTGPYQMGAESATNFLYIGSRDTSGTIIPFGIHDELKIYDEPVPAGLLFIDGFESGDLNGWGM